MPGGRRHGFPWFCFPTGAQESRGAGPLPGLTSKPTLTQAFSFLSQKLAISTSESCRLSNKNERVMSQALGPLTAVPDGSGDLQEK